MIVNRIPVTVEAFEAFTNLPQNADRTFELIGGQIVEVPSRPYGSAVAARITMYLMRFVMDCGTPGYVTGENGGYMVSGECYVPSVAYISKTRQLELSPYNGYNPNPPDLAVEVVSPSDSEKLLRTKVVNYLAAGTVVWVVYPEDKEVEVYRPGQPVQTVGADGTLDGGEILPGFSLAVKDTFVA